jgi:hypothetical protein
LLDAFTDCLSPAASLKMSRKNAIFIPANLPSRFHSLLSENACLHPQPAYRVQNAICPARCGADAHENSAGNCLKVRQAA